MINVVVWLGGFRNWFVGGIWKSLGLKARGALERSSPRVMGCADGSSEDQNAERKVGSGGPAHEVSAASKDSAGERTRAPCVTF